MKNQEIIGIINQRNRLRLVGVCLLAVLVMGSSMSFKLLPSGKIVIKPLCVRKGGYDHIIPIMSIWQFWYGNYILSFLRRITKAIHSVASSEVIRVDIGKMTMTKFEYLQMRDMMEKWKVDIGELCRYSVMSIIKAHSQP